MSQYSVGQLPAYKSIYSDDCEDGEVRCVVNGELYGYRAIRSALRAEGHRFSTDSDSEIALHLYKKLGGDFVRQLSHRGA
jgi:asparagine synthetase B (glutamine-hydrolysing)